jgi:hypothetical protein
LIAGSVTASALASGSVHSNHLAVGSVHSNALALGSIGSAQLAPSAALLNLNAAGYSAIPAGGMVMSSNINDGNLLTANFVKLGKVDLGDVWEQHTAASPPVARNAHTTVWTGTEMIVWGGFGNESVLASGGRYNPVTDMWTTVSLVDAPAARERHTAVWTGTEMIIWGGDAEGTRITDTGARYNPSSDTWTPLPEPTGMFVGVGMVGGKERDYGAVWTGVEMLVWGGAEASRGARYDPGSNVWQPISREGAPSRREGHTVIWSGSEMLVWGGAYLAPRSEQVFGDGGRYDPATDTWAPVSLHGAPGPRYAHTAVWTGGQMLVWGGCCDTAGGHNDGAAYTPRWLVVLAATPVYSISDEPLWIAQPGERYRVVEIESDWALAVAEGDSPDWSVWIHVDERVTLTGPRPTAGSLPHEQSDRD